jgi:hypothetical protein
MIAGGGPKAGEGPKAGNVAIPGFCGRLSVWACAQGKFRQNGNCGYVLKPEFMCRDDSAFDPHMPCGAGPWMEPRGRLEFACFIRC